MDIMSDKLKWLLLCRCYRSLLGLCQWCYRSINCCHFSPAFVQGYAILALLINTWQGHQAPPSTTVFQTPHVNDPHKVTVYHSPLSESLFLYLTCPESHMKPFGLAVVNPTDIIDRLVFLVLLHVSRAGMLYVVTYPKVSRFYVPQCLLSARRLFWWWIIFLLDVMFVH